MDYKKTLTKCQFRMTKIPRKLPAYHQKIPLQELSKKQYRIISKKVLFTYIKKSASNCEKRTFSKKKMKNPTRIKNETETKFQTFLFNCAMRRPSKLYFKIIQKLLVQHSVVNC